MAAEETPPVRAEATDDSNTATITASPPKKYPKGVILGKDGKP